MNLIVTLNVVWVIGESVFDMNDIQDTPAEDKPAARKYTTWFWDAGAELGGQRGPILLLGLSV